MNTRSAAHEAKTVARATTSAHATKTVARTTTSARTTTTAARARRLLIPVLGLAILLSGCLKRGVYLSDDEVVRKMEKQTGTEHVMILDKEEKDGYVLYHMKTDQRGIEFTAASHPSGDSGIYNPANVNVYDYVDAVHALYDDQIHAIHDELNGDNNIAVFKDRAELHVICQRIEEMDAIYRQELAYHDAKWLKTFQIDVVNISRRDAGMEKGDFSYGVLINGTIDADELEKYICDLYEERTGQPLK